jgi:hypothetical protein
MSTHFDLWPYSATLLIGGTNFVGFEGESDLLLVCSSAGRGVIDCTLPKVIARDPIDYYPEGNKADGIGPLATKTIDLIGFDGSDPRNLIVQRTERWEILIDARGSAFLKLRGEESLDQATCIARKGTITSLSACCLSPSEKFLVVAYRSDFTIFAKEGAFKYSSLYEPKKSFDELSKIKYSGFGSRNKKING